MNGDMLKKTATEQVIMGWKLRSSMLFCGTAEIEWICKMYFSLKMGWSRYGSGVVDYKEFISSSSEVGSRSISNQIKVNNTTTMKHTIHGCLPYSRGMIEQNSLISLV